MNQVGLSVADLKALVTGHLVHTRPVATAELMNAINYGYRKVIRAIRAVRATPFESYADPFSFTPGVNEYDVGTLFPRFFRPIRLEGGLQGGRRAQHFQYRQIQSDDYEIQENAAATGGMLIGGGTIYYDMLEGFLPGQSVALLAGSDTQTLNMATTTAFTVGGLVTLPRFGPVQTVPGIVPHNSIDLNYVGRVIVLNPTSIVVSPQLSAFPPAGVLVTAYRQRVLRLAASPAQPMTGRLWYQYVQDRLRTDSDVVDPVIAEAVDCLTAYALHRLKLSVGDGDADRWLRDAESLRAEVIQDLEPASYQNSEQVGSALYGLID